MSEQERIERAARRQEAQAAIERMQRSHDRAAVKQALAQIDENHVIVREFNALVDELIREEGLDRRAAVRRAAADFGVVMDFAEEWDFHADVARMSATRDFDKKQWDADGNQI